LYRGICYFKKVYRPQINRVKDDKGNLIADSHSILAMWRNHFSQLLNIHGVNDVSQTKLHTAEPLVPEPVAFEVELVIEKLKLHKTSGIDQTPTELIRQGVEQFSVTSINVLFLFKISGNCLRSGSSRSLYLSIRRAIKQTAVIIEA